MDETVKLRELADVLKMFEEVGFKVKLATTMSVPSAVLVFPDGTEALLFIGQRRNDYRDAVVLGWIDAWLARRHIYPHTHKLSGNLPWGVAYRTADGYDIHMGTFSCGYDRFDVTITAALKAVGKINYEGSEVAA
jgi:hypothetical protein